MQIEIIVKSIIEFIIKYLNYITPTALIIVIALFIKSKMFPKNT